MEMQDLLWSETSHTHENPQYSQFNSCENVGAQESQGSRNCDQETSSNEKMSQVKTALLVVCLMVTIVCTSATIILYTKVINNEKLLEKCFTQLNTLSTNFNVTSLEKTFSGKLSEVAARHNDTTRHTIYEFQVMKENFDMKLNEVGSRLNETIDNSTLKFLSAEAKVDAKLNEVAVRLNDTNDKTHKELRGLEKTFSGKWSEVAARHNDTTRHTIYEFQVMKENFDMKLNEVGSRLNETIDNSTLKFLSAEAKVDAKLNEVAVRLNDTNDKTHKELRGLEKTFSGKLGEVAARHNDTTRHTVYEFQVMKENFDMKLNEVGSRLNETIDNSTLKFLSAEAKVDAKLNEVAVRLNDTNDKTHKELRGLEKTFSGKLSEVAARHNDTTRHTIYEFQEKVDRKLDEVGFRLNTIIDNSTSKFLSLERKMDMKLNEVGAHLNYTNNNTLEELLGLEGKIDMKLNEYSARFNDIQNSISKLQNLLVVANCAETSKNGVYMLTSGVWVYCYNGWTVFQRRMDGSIPDFHNKTWEQYSQGFGILTREFWLGLGKLHEITHQGGCRLRVDLQSFDNDTAYAEYSRFSVADEANLYRVTIGGYSGTAGDSLTLNDPYTNINGMEFTTNDRDNDEWIEGNCATRWHSGGWWYNGCAHALPNGIYGDIRPFGHATRWRHWKGAAAMKFIQMAVRCD